MTLKVKFHVIRTYIKQVELDVQTMFANRRLVAVAGSFQIINYIMTKIDKMKVFQHSVIRRESNFSECSGPGFYPCKGRELKLISVTAVGMEG